MKNSFCNKYLCRLLAIIIIEGALLLIHTGLVFANCPAKLGTCSNSIPEYVGPSCQGPGGSECSDRGDGTFYEMGVEYYNGNCTGKGTGTYKHYFCCIVSECSGGGGLSTPPPRCESTPPTNVRAVPSQDYPYQSADITWTRGISAGKQGIMMATDEKAFDYLCRNEQYPCVVEVRDLPWNQESYTTGPVLSPQTVYYIVIVNYGTCVKPSRTAIYLSSCTLSPSSGINLEVGEKQQYTVNVNPSDAIQRVDFSAPPGNISVSPGTDTSYQYQTEVTALNPTDSSVTLTADVYATARPNPVSICRSTADVIVSETGVGEGPWWQVVDGDVATNGNLRSSVPDGEYFGLEGAGGYPGIPAYGGSTNLSTADASALGWIAQSSSTSSKIFNYQFFKNQIPGNVVPTDAVGGLSQTGATFFGYEWFKYTGPVDFNLDTAIDFGSRKVILLVENANLGINADITLDDGEDFFIAIVNGDINVNPVVTDLEGLYVADKTFSTGTAGVDSDTPLYVRGSVAAYGGVNLQRDLADDALPAETFEYAPDQILLFPSKLSYRKMRWKEVAP